MAQGLTLQQLQAMGATPAPQTGGLTLAQIQAQQNAPKPDPLNGFHQIDQPGFFQKTLQGVAAPFLKLARVPAGLAESAIGAISGNEIDKKRGADLLSTKPADFGPLGRVNQAGYDENGNKLSIGNTVKEAVGTGLEMGSYFVGGEAAGGAKGLLENGVKQVLKTGAKEGAAIGGLGSTGSALQDKNATPLSVVGTGLTGTILGTATGAIPGLVKEGAELVNNVKNIISPDVESALMRAIKPGKNNINFGKDLNMALPEVSDTLKLKGIDTGKMSINDLQSAILDTKKRIWDQYETVKSPNAHVQIDTAPIADSIEKTITPRFEMQNPNKADQIRGLADQYRAKTMTVGEAEQFLQEANAELHSYYAKNKVGQHVAASDPEIAAVVKEANGLREQLYGKLDELTGGDAGQIKKLYGALTNIGNEVEGRAQVFNRQNPASLQETIHYPWAMAKGAASLMRGDLVGAGESLAQIGLSRSLKESNSTEGLIRHAFTKFGKSVPK